MRKGGIVPKPKLDGFAQIMVQYFNDARSFAGIIDNPMTMDTLQGWQEHTGIILERWERDCLFAMDRAFRRAYNDVVKYHAKRPQVKSLKNGGRDWDKAKGNG